MKNVRVPAKHLINGEWVASQSTAPSLSPWTGEEVGTFHVGGEAEARAAVDAASDAFAKLSWGRLHSARADALEKLATSFEARAPDIASMLSQEGGKLLRETEWEVAGAIRWFRFAASTARIQNCGRAGEVAPGQHFYSYPEPAGVAAIISPWNSPIVLTARALAPALAAGCTTVIKLPHQTALTNALFAEAVRAVKEIPPGVVNIFTEIHGDGARFLVDTPKVHVVSFTGSTSVGRQIAQNAGKTLKRIGLELGGKTPLVVFNSANLDLTVPTLVRACTSMNGQYCCTGSRVLVQADVADRVRSALSESLSNIRLGPWDDGEKQIGPLVDEGAAKRVDAMVEEAASYGRILVRGGRVVDGPLAASGAFYRPSLVEVTRTDVRLVQEEVFGPVQTFEVFDDEPDAIRRANATEYGLCASIFTGDHLQARRVGREIQAGKMLINTWPAVSEQFESVGVKASGYGPLGGLRAIEEFQNLKIYSEVDPDPADSRPARR